jgi:hypothetical protein
MNATSLWAYAHPESAEVYVLVSTHSSSQLLHVGLSEMDDGTNLLMRSTQQECAGFTVDDSQPTIAAGVIGSNLLIQVTPDGYHVIDLEQCLGDESKPRVSSADLSDRGRVICATISGEFNILLLIVFDDPAYHLLVLRIDEQGHVMINSQSINNAFLLDFEPTCSELVNVSGKSLAVMGTLDGSLVWIHCEYDSNQKFRYTRCSTRSHSRSSDNFFNGATQTEFDALACESLAVISMDAPNSVSSGSSLVLRGLQNGALLATRVLCFEEETALSGEFCR